MDIGWIAGRRGRVVCVALTVSLAGSASASTDSGARHLNEDFRADRVVDVAPDERGAGEQSPKQVLETLQGVLLQAMRGGEDLGFSGRRRLIEPVAGKAHSAASLARLVLHANWDSLSEADQGRFVDALGRLTIAAYAARFDSYNGQRFEIVQEREMRDGVTLVRTRLIKADGKGVALDYFLRRFDAGWRIVNIVADGVSEVAVKRAEYDAIIAKDGFNALLDEIERQIADFEAGKDGKGG